MDIFKVTGGRPLHGTVQVAGAKNVALKVVAAGLMTREPLILQNMPSLSDVHTMYEILRNFGAQVEQHVQGVKIVTPRILSSEISLELGSKCKTGTVAFGPLLNLTGKAKIPNPGGCRIGARPIDRYIEGLKAMGADIRYEEGYYVAEAPNGLQGTRFHFYKNSHTGTETLILAGVLAKGTTVIENAAEEPEVNDLISLLNQMGAKITRSGRTVTIEGVRELHGTTYSIMGDPLEAETFACAALVTRGDVTITGVKPEHMRFFTQEVLKAGRNCDELENGVRVYGDAAMRAVDVTTTIYPGFRTDWQQPWCVVMTQAHGTSIIHETIFESRFAYTHELEKMGAHIELFRPEVENPDIIYNFNMDDEKPEYMHAAKITGPRSLHSAVLDASDLRAGATMVIAALCAQGTSIVRGVHHIERGYENFVPRLQSLGADIQVEEVQE